MSPTEFNNGYRYAAELKEFAKEIGIAQGQTSQVAPGLKRKSGARCRLNRWREEQIAKAVAITYRDVVDVYVRLSQSASLFAQIPHGRHINFVADFFAAETNATRERFSRNERSSRRCMCRRRIVRRRHRSASAREVT